MKIPSDIAIGTVHNSNNCGEFKVIDYISSTEIQVEFIDSMYRTIVRAARIRSGSIKDPYVPSVQGIGYLGVGQYSSQRDKLSYKTWRNMLARCYSGKYPSYASCTVCVEWECFQNFSHWFYKNYIEGYQLDKDIMGDGFEYSPTNCKFVSSEHNAMESNGTLGKSWVLVHVSTGKEVTISNQAAFAKSRGLHQSSLSKLCRGERSTSQGYRLKGVPI